MGQNNEKQTEDNKTNQQQQAPKPSTTINFGKIPIQPVPGSRGLRNKRSGIVSVYCEKNRQIYDIRLTPGLTVEELKEILTAKVDQKIFSRHVKLYLQDQELNNSIKLVDVIKSKNLLRMEIIDPTDYSVMEHSTMNIVLQSQKGEVRYQYKKNGPLNQTNRNLLSPTSSNAPKEDKTFDLKQLPINGRYTPQNNSHQLNNSSSESQVSNNTADSAPSQLLKIWDKDFSVYSVPEIQISTKLYRKNKQSQLRELKKYISQNNETEFLHQFKKNNLVIEEMEEEETGKQSFVHKN